MAAAQQGPNLQPLNSQSRPITTQLPYHLYYHNLLFLHIQCYHTHHWSFQKIWVQSLQASSGNVSVTSFSKLVFLTLIFCMHLSKFITFTDFMLMLSRCMFVVSILANQKHKNSSEVQLQESNANTTDYIFSNWINSN